jgi:hypothetical protein
VQVPDAPSGPYAINLLVYAGTAAATPSAFSTIVVK